MKRARRITGYRSLRMPAMIAIVEVAIGMLVAPASPASAELPYNKMTIEPADQTSINGSEVTFTAQITGRPGWSAEPLWNRSPYGTPGPDEFSDKDITTTVTPEGVTTTRLVLHPTPDYDGAKYMVKFYYNFEAEGDVYGAYSYSDSGKLTVLSTPKVTTQPVDETRFIGSPVSFSADSTSNPQATVQWERSIKEGPFTPIDGAVANSYNLTPTEEDLGARFRARFTNSIGSSISRAARLFTPMSPRITANPVSQIASFGERVTLSSAAIGHPDPTVQWRRSIDGGTTYTNVADGGTEPDYTFTATEDELGAMFIATYSNERDSANTAPATVTQTASGPRIVANPTDVTASPGDSVTFSGRVIGVPVPTVQWQKSTNDGAVYADIAGATDKDYTFIAPAGDLGDQFRAVFTNDSGHAATASATLNATPPPSTPPDVASQPLDAAVLTGGNATFTVGTSGYPPPTVQWQRSNDGTTFTDIPGATSTSYTVEQAAAADDDATFRAAVTNTTGTAISNAATLTVSDPPPTPTTTNTPPNAANPVAVGRSAQGSLSVRTGGDTYTDLGGVIVGTPVAVQAADGGALFITRSADRNLWIRNTESHWKRLAPTGTTCNDPDATISGTTLTVTCRTATNSVSFATATITPGALPTLGAFTDLGGSVTSGAAVWVDAGVTHVAAVGKYGKTVFTRTTATTGAGSTFSGTNSLCSATPTALVTGGHTYIACRNADGALAISRDDATPVTKGKIVGRVGLVAAGANLAATVEGTDGRVLDAPVDATTAAIGSFLGQTNKVTTGVTAATPLS